MRYDVWVIIISFKLIGLANQLDVHYTYALPTHTQDSKNTFKNYE